jgi:hypothetical protein
MNEEAIKYIIRRVIFSFPNSDGNQAPHIRPYAPLDLNQGNAIVEAVFTTLRAAGALKVSR